MNIYFNGEITDDKAIFEFQDRLRLGDGVFDTMLIINGMPLYIDDHIKRLIGNAKILHIENTPNAEHLKNAALQLIESNEAHTGHFALNTLITRGISERGLTPSQNAKPNIAMRITPVPKEFPSVHAIISKAIRRNEGSPLSQIKSCNYGDNILALVEARESDANEVILLNNAEKATCASAGNIFCCIDGELITPPLSDGVMDGVTRKIIIEKYNAIERSINEKELLNADGIYITNSIRGIMPVISLNGKTLPAPSIKIDKDFHIKCHSKH